MPWLSLKGSNPYQHHQQAIQRHKQQQQGGYGAFAGINGLNGEANEPILKDKCPELYKKDHQYVFRTS